MTSPDAAASAVVETAAKASQGASILTHIVERRLEYLIGTLIAHQLGLIEQVMTYGSGMC